MRAAHEHVRTEVGDRHLRPKVGIRHCTDRPVVAYAILAAAVLLVLSPLARGMKDDFPLSSYPMFSTPKDEKAVVDHAVVVSEDGRERILSPKELGTDEVLQAETVLIAAVRGGKKSTAAFCASIAKRLAASPPPGSPPKSVEIRTVTYDSGTYLRDDDAPPEKNVVRARCPVKAP
ncbi:MAG TPA: hypothetical protein VL400_26200 [Polyangiaceae bacterium]|nr:hypothetical protein [Polyangiaceae bacterium]